MDFVARVTVGAEARRAVVCRPAMWLKPFPLPSHVANAWLTLCPRGGWRVVSAADIPPPISPSLTRRCDQILVMAVGTEAGTIYVLASLSPIGPGAFEQVPFGFAILTGTGSTGLRVHHGYWQSRSSSGALIPVPWQGLGGEPSTELRECFAALPPPRAAAGSLTELGWQVERAVFADLVEQVNALYDGKRTLDGDLTGPALSGERESGRGVG